MKKILIAAIKGYQIFISPYIQRSCRYFPTCSEYAREAIDTYGVMKGLVLAVRRILRCHPFAAGGIDLVIKEKHKKKDDSWKKG